MALVRLDHEKVNALMRQKIWRPTDLAVQLGLSRQHINYILKKGGLKYASRLAALFGCGEDELKIHINN